MTTTKNSPVEPTRVGVNQFLDMPFFNSSCSTLRNIRDGGCQYYCAFVLNRYKKSHPTPSLSWEARRNAFWILIATSVSFSCFLDVHFPIEAKFMIPIKSYVFAFPLGLLDLYFSETKGVPMKVILGASLWCSTIILRNIAIDTWFGYSVDSVVIIDEFTMMTLPRELLRY
eukprot:UN23833